MTGRFGFPKAGGLRRNDRGFSAVELMVAITVMAILLLGFLGVFPLGMRTVQKSENLSKATNLVQDEIERLKTLPLADPDLAAGAHSAPDNPVDGIYNISWTVTDDVPLPDMKQVDVLVNYADAGIPRNIQMTTYLAETDDR